MIQYEIGLGSNAPRGKKNAKFEAKANMDQIGTVSNPKVD